MEDTTKKVAMKFLLSNTLTGSLIGTGGKSIKELVEVTGARVNASNASDTYPGTSDRVILISGSKETVSLAQTLVWELLGLMADTPREKARSVEWSPRGTLGKLGTHDATEVTARFTIPAASGGLILGKGGDSIKNIAQETGVKIAMSTKEEALFTQERIITVTGRVSQCIACTDLIISKLAEQEEIPPFVNRGTTYSSPLTSTLGVKGSARAAEETIGDATVASTTITINVPDEYIGNIFGKQGATMREIISLSGAKVVVSPRGTYAEGTKNRIVTITGSPISAQTAHIFITKRLKTPSNPPPVRKGGKRN